MDSLKAVCFSVYVIVYVKVTNGIRRALSMVYVLSCLSSDIDIIANDFYLF